MTTSSDPALRLALVGVLGLLPGVALGLFGAPDASQAPASLALVGDAAIVEEHGADADESPAARADQGAGDERADAHATRRESVTVADADEANGERTLLEELRDLLASGRIEAEFSEEGGGLAHLLVRLYVEIGDHGQALALIDGLEDAGRRIGLYQFLMESSIASAPDVAANAAERALRLSLELHPPEAPFGYGHPHSYYLSTLSKVDPARALGLLGELRALGMADDLHATALEIDALVKLGMVERARELALAIATSEDNFAFGFQQLRSVDPVAAEGMLRERLEGPQASWARGQLVSLLAEQGRTGEAIAMFEEALTAGDGDTTLWNALLGQLPKATIDAHVDAWLALSGDVPLGTLQAVANYYANTDDTWATLTAYEDLWDQLLPQNGWLQQLPDTVISAHPNEVLAMLDGAIASNPSNDEIWGDLADTYWKLGAEAEALAAWKKANEIDPNDGEWTSKIAATESGQPPIYVDPGSTYDGDMADLYGDSGPLPVFGGGGFPGWGSGVPYPGQFFNDGEVIYESGGSSLNLGFGGGLEVLGYSGDVGYFPEEIEILDSIGYVDMGGATIQIDHD